MSAELVTRIRKNRELRIPVGAFVFLGRRPTDSEMQALFKASVADDDRIAQDFIWGWENVTENDVVGGGGSDLIKFDARLWREWCADRPDFWVPIAQALVDAYNLHRAALAEAAKNSQPGLS